MLPISRFARSFFTTPSAAIQDSRSGITRAIIIITVGVLLLGSDPIRADYSVTHEYPPARWATPICLVDDWQKSLVDDEGRLVYDFGPGPYARPKTTVAVEVKEATDASTSQTLLDPRIPVILTEHSENDLRWRQSAFAMIPDTIRLPGAMSPDSSFRRYEGLTGSPAWVESHPDRDPAFQSVAWGTGRSIRYDVQVPAGSRRKVALGFIEVYRHGQIVRLMDLLVEGAEKQTVDLIEAGGQDVPQVFFFAGQDIDDDGWLSVEVTASPRGQDPNVLLCGIWLFQPEKVVTKNQVISGAATPNAERHIDAGMELLDAGLVRRDMLRTEISGSEGTLQLRLNTLRPLTVDTATATLLFDDAPFLTTRPAFTQAKRMESDWVLSFADTCRQVDVLVTHGVAEGPVTFPDLDDEQNRAIDYWQHVSLPWDRLTVPDAGIQALIDGGIRTLYQVRENVDGHYQFQPGPTLYRGLWYGDAGWGLDVATWLDDKEAARQTIQAMLEYQDPDGRAGVMKPALLHRETGHLIYSMCRYARLFQDWAWLDRHWSQLERAVQYVIELRQQTLADPAALNYGLMPAGLTDGGIAGIGTSYGSVIWSLIALGEAVQTAQVMRRPEAEAWKNEYQDFIISFRRAVERDKRRDEYGNWFLPIKMDYDPATDVPQRGQWAMLHALYVGQLFSPTESLIDGTLNLLDRHTVQGLTHSVGWLDDGVWPIFDGHRALACLWRGNADKAEELLYAVANHATPTLLYGEEQSPKGEGTRVTGDIPHIVGNIQMVRVTRNMLLLERDTDLHLLAGLPKSWLRAGARLSVLSLPTFFGPASIKLDIDDSGMAGTLWIQTPNPDTAAGTVRLTLDRLIGAGYSLDGTGELLPDDLELPWNHLYRLEFKKQQK